MLRCKNCGYQTPTYSRECPSCFSVQTLEAVKSLPPPKQGRENSQGTTPDHNVEIFSSGFTGLDSLLGGGLQTSSIILCSARYGTAKTTMAIQISSYLVKNGRTVLFFSGEETHASICKKAGRLGLGEKMPELFFGKTISEISGIIRETRPFAVFIDSVQTTSVGNMSRVTNAQQDRISMAMRNIADDYGCVVWENCQNRKDFGYLGPTGLAHNADVHLELRRGINDEIIASTPTKNRLGPTGNRAVFRMTANGLVEKSENETGFLLRHQVDAAYGIAAFVTETQGDYSVDEITVTLNTVSEKSGITIEGWAKSQTEFLASVMQKHFKVLDLDCIARANLTEKPSRSMDLAAVMAVLSYYYKRPIPFSTVFLASFDAEGTLLPLLDMAQRAKRAYAQGYTHIFGPVAIGSQKAEWTESVKIRDVWDALG
jgi:DNA repair protein RadA/Sms